MQSPRHEVWVDHQHNPTLISPLPPKTNWQWVAAQVELVRFLAHQEIQQDITLLATATYLALKDGDLFVLILQPILQSRQSVLQDLHQRPHLQLTDLEVHHLKPLPHHFNLPQSVGVALHLFDNLNKPVDHIPVLLDHVPKGHGFMRLEGSLPSHLRHLQLHLTDVFNMLRHILANDIHQVAHLLEVVKNLCEELCPLLLLGCLRNQLRRCHPHIVLNHVDIPLVPSP